MALDSAEDKNLQFHRENAPWEEPQPPGILPPADAGRKRDRDRPWSPLDERLDGRFRWADGGKPEPQTPWQLARELQAADQATELPVIGYNKGGLLVDWHGLQGFVPISHLRDFPSVDLEEARQEELNRRQDQRLTLKIIELDEATNRLIFSERGAQTSAAQRQDVLQRLRPGDVVQGRVTNLAKFGAFVDLGGVEGLIHISELSWTRVYHPGDVVRPDQEVAVLVLGVNSADGHVALSLKQLRPDPWQTAAERYVAGQLVEGAVSNVRDFGVFVRLEEGLDGLIHVSELSENAAADPHAMLRKGETVLARILSIDGPARRIALSLRR